MQLYRNKYVSISYNENDATMEQRWTRRCKNLLRFGSDYKQAISVLQSITQLHIEKFQPNRVLVNSKDFGFNNMNSTQMSVDTLAAEYETNTNTKVAFVVPRTIFSRQIGASTMANNNIKFFIDEDKARTWLQNVA